MPDLVNLWHRPGDEAVQHPGEAGGDLDIRRMADAMEDVEEAAVFGEGEVFREHVMQRHRRVLIATDDQYRYGEFMKVLAQPQARHGPAAA